MAKGFSNLICQDAYFAHINVNKYETTLKITTLLVIFLKIDIKFEFVDFYLKGYALSLISIPQIIILHIPNVNRKKHPK